MRPMNSRRLLMAVMLAGAAFLATGERSMAQQQMGPGMMNQGTMNQGMMGPGMMGSGMMGSGMMGGARGCPGLGGGMDGTMSPGMMGMMHQGGMMGSGMMGPGMMGPGMMGQGMMGGDMRRGLADGSFVMLPAPPQLSVADVTYNLERLLAARDNPHLKLGTVAEKDAETLTGEIVTTDGSLVERYEVDKRTGVARLVP